MAVKLIPCEIEGEVGLDVVIANQDATVADLIQALQQPADDSTIITTINNVMVFVAAVLTTAANTTP